MPHRLSPFLHALFKLSCLMNSFYAKREDGTSPEGIQCVGVHKSSKVSERVQKSKSKVSESV